MRSQYHKYVVLGITCIKDTVKDSLLNKLGIGGVELERVHRIGPYSANKTVRPRTIVAQFSIFKKREMVRKNANKLKGTYTYRYPRTIWEGNK